MHSSEYLPEYTVRVSRRARRIGLRVLPGKGLEVVLPLYADQDCVPDIVRRHRRWIDAALLRVSAVPLTETPGDFTLGGGRERVVLRPEPRMAQSARGGAKGRGHPCAGLCPLAPLQVSGVPCVLSNPAPGEATLCRPLSVPGHIWALPDRAAGLCGFLREWVRREARARLSALLRELAEGHGLEQRDVGVRFQRTRWGSCSRRGGISLNACLLFLPERLARHIVLHELCHTRHMNHGEGFWKLLFSCEPDALARDREMRGAWKHVPQWIFETQ